MREMKIVQFSFHILFRCLKIIRLFDAVALPLPQQNNSKIDIHWVSSTVRHTWMCVFMSFLSSTECTNAEDEECISRQKSLRIIIIIIMMMMLLMPYTHITTHTHKPLQKTNDINNETNNLGMNMMRAEGERQHTTTTTTRNWII